MASATAGFRGPAKRAAFGDVTNMSRPSAGTRDDGKVGLKAQPSLVSVLGPIGENLNKENASYGKDSLARPAQRPAALGNKIKPLSDSHSIPPLKSAFNAPRALAQQDHNAASNVPHSRSIKEEQHPLPAIPQSTTTARSTMQPRHYKSQPQLKPQQPPLRRTQSKFLEKIDHDSSLDIPEEPELEELLVPALEQASGHTVYFDTGPYHIDSESQPQAHEVEPMPLATNAPAAAEARPSTGHSYKESSYPALSEPEEWDEEEDEEYDDQDQAYTTAHSFRSRDYNTVGATTVLAPRVTARIQRELDEARIEVEESSIAEDFEDEAWDVSMVAEYGDEIFEYLRELEASTPDTDPDPRVSNRD